MRTTLIILLAAVFGLIFVLWQNQARSLPKVVFCDVGQGDAVYMRLPSQQDVLIDAGPYSQVINCLNQEMPYFDRQIELIFLTHPEKDHYGGLKYLLESYQISRLYLPESVRLIKPNDEAWREVWQKARKRIGQIDYLVRGDELLIGQSSFTILWPENKKYKENEEVDFNNTGLGILATIKDKQILLLADMDIAPAESAIEKLILSTEVFKINHHGSKYGTSLRLLELANPALAVISAGANNWHGHPHPDVIQLLQSLNIPYKRTDKNGKVVVML